MTPFATLGGELHGLAFGDTNYLYTAEQGRRVYRLNPQGDPKLLAEIKTNSAKTYIYNLTWGKDGRLYAAARDRILAIDTNGTVSTLIQDNFTGLWGACDLRFDSQGRLYVVHGTTLSRYDTALRKENLIAYPLGELPPPTLVGIEFDRSGAGFYLSYCFMRKVVHYDLSPVDGLLGTATTTGLPCPQYIAVDAAGNAYVTQPDANQVVKIATNGQSSVVAASARWKGPTTIAFGRGDFGSNTLYVTAGDTIWQVRLGTEGVPPQSQSATTSAATLKVAGADFEFARIPEGDFKRASGGVGAAAEREQVRATKYPGFVLVQGGTFQMGDVWGDSPWAMKEVPIHEVQVDDFLLAKYETTVAEFERFVKATGYTTVHERNAGTEANRGILRDGKLFYPSWREHWFSQTPDQPVVMIAWEDAIQYCNWFSRQHQLPPAYDERTKGLLTASGQPTRDVRQVRGFRLPTEAEWEFAARERGRKVRFGNGQNIARAGEINFDAAGTGKMIPKLRMKGANLYPYNEKGTNWGGTSPVGSFRPNALGLHDMSGNAWEWCTDNGGTDYPAEKQINPCVQGGSGHVIRGGMYDTDAKACRASARIDWYPNACCPGSGFRLALTVDPPESGRPDPPTSRTQPAHAETDRPGAPTSITPAQADVPTNCITVAIAGATFELVRVPQGRFQMGSDFRSSEQPVHWVDVPAFGLGKSEVTVRQFEAFTQATGYRTVAEQKGGAWKFDWTPSAVNWREPGFRQRLDNPVVRISWHDAVAFCEWLSRETGLRFRLPSEAEGEYGCRAGTTGDYAGHLDELAWYRANSGGTTHPVWVKPPNAWGLAGMHGNAWEWCADNWHQSYTNAPADAKPWLEASEPGHGFSAGQGAILRGGAWALPARASQTAGNGEDCRASSRAPYPQGERCNNSGFRVALDLASWEKLKTRSVATPAAGSPRELQVRGRVA
ncbi:MAG: SUMF1/EgtB/PvdO family nonheme iron enzyme [Bryobacteraceae bacterium]|nr:SUMF1/EgtB/PvdO family nonheme iron enzyme [Bryobacteraceae bacterium]